METKKKLAEIFSIVTKRILTGVVKSDKLKWQQTWKYKLHKGKIASGYLCLKQKIACLPKSNPAIPQCEAVISNLCLPPDVIHRPVRPVYYPSDDSIFLPHRKHYNNSGRYYSSLFHELIHATGHGMRLNRKEIMKFTCRSEMETAREELVAEIGTCFLLYFMGITEGIRNNIAYIQMWGYCFEKSYQKRAIIKASEKAHAAAEYLLITGAKQKGGEDERQ